MPLLLFEGLQDFRKTSFTFSLVRLLESNWYIGDTNWYMSFFTLFDIWLVLDYYKLK